MKRNGIFVLVAVLSLAGLVFSLMALDLHIEHVVNPEKADSYCNISANLNCDAVIKSDWSMLWGRPIAWFGVAFYLGLFLLSSLSLVLKGVSRRSKLDALLVIAIASVFESLFLLYISVFQIETVCPVCAGVYVVNFLLLLAIWVSDRSVSLLTRTLSGIGVLILAPGRLITVWFKSSEPSVKVFTAGIALVAVGSLFAAEYSFMQIIKFRQMSMVEAKLDLPWPKDYQLPDTIQINKGAWGDYYKGEPESPIKIIEMFDYECGHCRYFYSEVSEILKEYEGKYLLVFKNYPLDKTCNAGMQVAGHRNACYAALLARCAGEQGRFHEVSDYLLRGDMYGRDEPASTVRAEMDKVIDLYGLDVAELRSCMEADRQLDHIKADIELGNMLGLTGTPTVWVNGKKLPGLDPLILRKVFDDILGR